MRHVGEAEASVSVGLERRAAREMSLADHGTGGHLRNRHVEGWASGGNGLFVASEVDGRKRNKISSGPATKIDE